MARLRFDDYLRHLERESARFRTVLADCDPTARVPGCPDWDAADLLWHLAEVQWFWATTITSRPAPADEEAEGPPRPTSYPGLLAAFDEFSTALVAALRSADPGEPAWTWSAEQTVGFTYRRQAHEALIHRLDAEQTTGQVTPLDPALAADGVDEALDVMYGGAPPWGRFAPSDQFVRVDITDVGASLWVQLGRFTGTAPDGTTHDSVDLRVVADPGVDPDALLRGPAAELDAWLWRRGDDAALELAGDRVVGDLFRACVDQPIT